MMMSVFVLPTIVPVSPVVVIAIMIAALVLINDMVLDWTLRHKRLVAILGTVSAWAFISWDHWWCGCSFWF